MKVVKVSNTLDRQEGSAVLIAAVSLHILSTHRDLSSYWSRQARRDARRNDTTDGLTTKKSLGRKNMTQTIPLDPSMIAYGCKCLRQCSARGLRGNFMQPLAFCGFLRKALVWRILSTRVSVVVCGCSAQHSGAERKDFMQHLSDMEPKRVPKNTNIEPKGYQNEPRNLQKHVLRNGNEKERKKGVPSSIYWLPFGSHLPLKIQPKDHSKLDLEKH